MKDAKEFHGKTLDDAIMSACKFYGVEREKLEIEIVNDSKMGIFGLVNVKKACVRASLASTSSFLENLTESLGQPEQTAKGNKESAAGKAEKTKTSQKTAPKTARTGSPKSDTTKSDTPKTTKAGEGKTTKTEEGKGAKTSDVKASKSAESKNAKAAQAKNAPKNATEEKSASLKDEPLSGPINGSADSGEQSLPEEEGEKTKGTRSSRKERAPRRQDSRPRRGRNNGRTASVGEGVADDECNDVGEAFALADLDSLNQEELHGMIHDVVNRLVGSIIGEVPLAITVDDGHIRVKVDCDEDARILVGREGQTLASVQYIASRILSGKLNGAVRLHIDTGNYKENQDARLTSLARMLAEKLRKTGRTQSTRPLSAYQRRIVHLALEDEEDIQTSSKGEGHQRRVLIHFKRNRNQKGAQAGDTGTDDDAVNGKLLNGKLLDDQPDNDTYANEGCGDVVAVQGCSTDSVEGVTADGPSDADVVSAATDEAFPAETAGPCEEVPNK